MKDYNCIVVLGPTASGKTRLACELASRLNGEVISADSRQVYRCLDIGTGKDLDEYMLNGNAIAYHLINVAEPSEQFYLHQFVAGLLSSFTAITQKHKLPVICGGTGLYLDALRKDFRLTEIGEDPALRAALEPFTKEQLSSRLSRYPATLIKHVDIHSKKRLIRGIEIAEHLMGTTAVPVKSALPYRPFYIGIDTGIELRKQMICSRLAKRLGSGLVEEVQSLLDNGVTADRLTRLGLEYKFVLRFIRGGLLQDELINGLQTAIFQFAKRQMTWFRKMEKEGVMIHWIKNAYEAEELLKSTGFEPA